MANSTDSRAFILEKYRLDAAAGDAQARYELGIAYTPDILHAEISQHNLEKFEEEARERFAGMSPGRVLNLPFRTRKEAGIHHPYTLAGVPFPHRTEQSHVMLIGTTGSGKTTELRSLVTQMRERQDSYGYNNTRDASTLTPRKQVEPLVIADDITNLPSMHGFVKFPDGFPAARILLEWKDYPQVAQGFVLRPDIQPVRSKRGEEAFGEGGDVESGGRDGAGQVIEEVSETTNLAKELAARILSAEVEEEQDTACRAAQRADDQGEQTAPAVHAADKAQAARVSGEEQPVATRDKDREGDRRSDTPRAPQVEDLTLVELRQAFHPGRDDDGVDMGI